MKKLILVVVVFLSVVALGQAQTQAPRGAGQRPSAQQGGGNGGGGGRPQMDPAQMADRQVQQLNEALTLTDAQKTKIKDIIIKASAKQRESMQSMNNSGGEPDREKMRAARQEMQKKQSEEIKAVLTAAQLPKYEQYLKDREARMRERMGGGN